METLDQGHSHAIVARHEEFEVFVCTCKYTLKKEIPAVTKIFPCKVDVIIMQPIVVLYK